jgi:(p)ppGpp synthase/HD superfamily hydrolase
MNHAIVLKAADFAADKHRIQRRKDESASPYINHPISVALVIAEIGGIADPEILAAALLHDTIEDTKTTAEELEEIFGERIRRIVEEVSDDKGLAPEERKRLQVEHAAKLSPGAVIVKIADKISNVKDLINTPPLSWSLERKKRYLEWAESVIKNCPKVNKALEDYFSNLIEKGRRKFGMTDKETGSL